MDFLSKENQFKRKFPRRRFLRSVGFLFNGDYYVGMGVEIGEGGLSLNLPVDLPVGRQGVVSFQLPEGSFICLRVEVRRSNKEGAIWTVGCLFKNLHFEQKREIRAYVSARATFEH